MRLFKDGIRTEMGRIQPGQATLAWLDECGKPEAISFRENLQTVFDHIPADNQERLAARLRSNGTDHNSAVAELFAHEMLRQSGLLVDIDPLAVGGSRPDFRVTYGDFCAYVEVTVDLGPEAARRRREAIDKLFMNVTKRVQTPGFAILADEIKAGKKELPARRLVTFLDRWFRGLDHATERINVERNGLMALPCFQA